MKIYLAIGSIDNTRLKLFTEEKVQHVLVSYATVKGRADIRLPFSDVIMDSGAYSVETGNAAVNIEAYTLWLQLYLKDYPQIKHYVNLDDLSDPEKSLWNLRYMENEGLSPMPVYHYGEDLKCLDLFCEKHEYVGLGGIAVGTIPVQRLESFWVMIHNTHPETKFHMFGVGTMTPFFKHQPYSMDCTTWNVGARFGDILGYKYGVPCRISEDRETDGFKMFFTTEELFRHNIRALMDWEKCEWVDKVKIKEGEKIRLF